MVIPTAFTAYGPYGLSPQSRALRRGHSRCRPCPRCEGLMSPLQTAISVLTIFHPLVICDNPQVNHVPVFDTQNSPNFPALWFYNYMEQLGYRWLYSTTILLCSIYHLVICNRQTQVNHLFLWAIYTMAMLAITRG